MTGAQINQIITELLAEHNLAGVHHPDSRRAAAAGHGWPDWVIVGRRILFREVKGHNDVLRPHQRRMARYIMLGGGDWAVWGPADFYPRGRARRELEQISLKGISV